MILNFTTQNNLFKNIWKKLTNSVLETELGALKQLSWHLMGVFYMGMFFGINAALLVNFFFFMNNQGKRENWFTTIFSCLIIFLFSNLI